MFRDRPGADAELSCNDLARGAGEQMTQHLALSPREPLPALEVQRCAGLSGGAAHRHPADPRDQVGGRKRRLDEIGSSDLERLHRNGNIAMTRDHQDRRRTILAAERAQDFEAGSSRHQHIEENAGRRGAADLGLQRVAIDEKDRLVSGLFKDDLQHRAHRQVILEDEDFT